MNVIDFIKGIKFVSCQPSDSWSKLDVENTLLPEPVLGMEIVAQVPHMSSYATGSIINKIVSSMPAGQCFVNVGVWHGFMLFSGMLNNPKIKCIGVDNFSEFAELSMSEAFFGERFKLMRTESHLFFKSDYESYFKNFHVGEIGFYIYDASHDYSNQLKGLKLAEPFMADDSFIMIDDINWEAPKKATMDFIDQSDFNWEIVHEVHTSALAHPTWWNGILIIQKKGRKNEEKKEGND